MRARSALTAALEKAGFTLVRCNKHAIWVCPCGHTKVTMPTTPGRGCSALNSHGLMARTLKACEQRKAA